jgi:hypothetical protein
MKKYLFLIILFCSTFLFAQTEQQSIELPDFVITGRQNIDIPTAVKKKPELVSTISQDFLTPQYSPEEFPLLFSSLPVQIQPGIKPFNDYYNGTIKVEAGKYSLPTGVVSLNQNIDNYLFNASIWGSNIQEYIPNSGYNNIGFSLSNELFFSTRSDFLPGSKIKFGADYFRDSYHLFATKDPSFLRERNNGTANFSIGSSYNRWINYDFGLTGNIYSLSESGLKETNLNANGLFEFKLNSFTIGALGNYKKQTLENNASGINGNSYYSIDGYIKLLPIRSLLLTFGVDYSSNTTDSFFSPFGLFEFNFDNGFTLSGKYKPHADYLNTTDIFNINRYYNPGMIDNVFLKYKTDLSILLKYEYKKMYSISLSGGYSKVENYFYFEDAVDFGKFDLFVLPEASIFSAGFEFIINPSYYGAFSANIKFRDVKDDLDRIVPYEPKISSTLFYGYNFSSSLGFNVKYLLELSSYTNIINSNKLDNYHNISFSLFYELFKGFKLTANFQNILNQSNFVWKQYQEKPFDLLFGIEYRW